ncbi:MAG TPA: hypothetical protein DCR14_06310, partial [Acidimicrobiaceae bacterium]|nr:hypothetical protein [Acidimicrobiaceae bacterium]
TVNYQNLPASASITWVPCPPPTAPVADNDFYTTPEDTSLTVTVQNLLVGDYDINPGDTVSVDVSAGTFFQSAHGIYVVNDNGNFTYWPNDNFTGTDTFTYRATDGTLFSELATVTIEVTPVNDAPVANNDDYTVAQDDTLAVPAPGILDNDTDPDSGSLTPTIVDTPSHGLLVPAADGSFVYTPDTGYSGTDTFTYTVSDG